LNAKTEVEIPMKSIWMVPVLFILQLTVLGCRQDATETSDKTPESGTQVVTDTNVLLTTEPQGAENVVAARKSAQDGDELVVVGRIGGGANPWIEGRAVFSIVDESLEACNEIPGDECQTPWDYCCVTDQLPASTALVKVVDENGDLVQIDARRLLNVKELATVVVLGKAKRDEAGNLTVLASGVFVKESSEP
jgi:hypothetical protein